MTGEQIQRLLDKLPDDPRRMVLRNEVVDRRRQEKHLIDAPVAKGFAGHSESLPMLIRNYST